MRPFTTRGPPADGGYPLDGDLHRMTDDGGPHAPDPARWADPDWRDNLGEWDTFAEQLFPTSPPPGAGAVTVRRPRVLSLPVVLNPFEVRRRAADPGDQPGETARVLPWSSVRVEGDAAAVWTARRSGDGGVLDS